MRRFAPRTVSSQLIAVAMLALAVSQIAMLAITAHERQYAAREWWSGFVLSRIASVIELLDLAPDTMHQHVINASDIEDLTFAITSAAPEGRQEIPDSAVYKQELLLMIPREPEGIAVHVHEMTWGEMIRRWAAEWRDAPDATASPWLEVGISLNNGKWLLVEANPRLNPPSAAVLLVPVITMLVVFGSALVIVVKRINRPVQNLAEAAEAFGRGDAGQPIPVSGPTEISDAIEAFNAMRERLSRFVLDRTKMLAAVGHDLRTPITTMRLRAEFIEDDETRERILASLDEIQQIAEAALAFAREEAISEPVKPVDLNALVQTVCADQADMRREVTYCDAGRMPYRCRPNSLKRAVRNIVENAVIHGRRARVSLNGPGGEAWITVDDDGPGIPPDKIQQVFMPFMRIDAARGQETGGIGLGLAIARSIVRGHGGDIEMENRPEGGLRARIRLPVRH